VTAPKDEGWWHVLSNGQAFRWSQAEATADSHHPTLEYKAHRVRIARKGVARRRRLVDVTWPP
jgi:hypothetical protein